MKDDDSDLEQESSVVAHFPDNESLEITSVEKLRRPKGRYLISFGPYSVSVHEDVVVKYRMMKGNSFWKQELEDIILADEKQQAYVHGLSYLGHKPRTRKEIADRLRDKGMEANTIEVAVQRLENEGLVNDEIYAKQWAEQRITNQRKGKAWVRQELQQKGVDKVLITEALAEVSPEQEFDSALVIGRKKWNQIKGEILDKKRKTGAYLMRRGFSGDQVRNVINRLIQEDNLPEDEEESYSFD